MLKKRFNELSESSDSYDDFSRQLNGQGFTEVSASHKYEIPKFDISDDSSSDSAPSKKPVAKLGPSLSSGQENRAKNKMKNIDESSSADVEVIKPKERRNNEKNDDSNSFEEEQLNQYIKEHMKHLQDNDNSDKNKPRKGGKQQPNNDYQIQDSGSSSHHRKERKNRDNDYQNQDDASSSSHHRKERRHRDLDQMQDDGSSSHHTKERKSRDNSQIQFDSSSSHNKKDIKHIDINEMEDPVQERGINLSEEEEVLTPPRQTDELDENSDHFGKGANNNQSEEENNDHALDNHPSDDELPNNEEHIHSNHELDPHKLHNERNNNPSYEYEYEEEEDENENINSFNKRPPARSVVDMLHTSSSDDEFKADKRDVAESVSPLRKNYFSPNKKQDLDSIPPKPRHTPPSVANSALSRRSGMSTASSKSKQWTPDYAKESHLDRDLRKLADRDSKLGSRISNRSPNGAEPEVQLPIKQIAEKYYARMLRKECPNLVSMKIDVNNKRNKQYLLGFNNDVLHWTRDMIVEENEKIRIELEAVKKEYKAILQDNERMRKEIDRLHGFTSNVD